MQEALSACLADAPPAPSTRVRVHLHGDSAVQGFPQATARGNFGMENIRLTAERSAQPLPASPFSHSPRPPYRDEDTLVRHFHDRRLRANTMYEAVQALAEGKFVAAHFHRAFSPDECDAVHRRAVDHHGRSAYEGAPDIGHIGMSLFETAFGEEQREAYFANALRHIEESRAMWGAGRFPLDLIRALLDEASPMGAHLLRIGGRVCSAGLVRCQEDGANILSHLDHVGWDVPDSIEAQQVEAQITAVLLLSQGATGGETLIRPIRLGKPQYDAKRLTGRTSYAIDDADLAGPLITLTPQVGDLMLFDARHIHRVNAPKGRRYSLSFFIGVCRDGSLVIFS
jgi:hypothetical protein